MSINNVIIIGAGGHLGPSILSALDADPHFTVSILARQSSTSTFPAHIKVHRVADDYPEGELLEAFKGQDAIISTIATAGAMQQRVIIDAAIKAGVRRFVPSEFGSDTRNDQAMAILPQYFQRKLDTVNYLKEKEKEGLTWTAFVTGPFFELAMQLFMGFDLKEQKATIFNDGKVPWSTTTFSSIGLAVKNALRIPEKTANKYLFINSFTVSQSQILAALENLTGSKWKAEYVDAEAQKTAGIAKMSKGDFTGAMSLIRYINCVDGHGGNYALYEETANELLSLPKENLEMVLAGVLEG